MKFNKRVLLELKAMALCLVVACMEAPILYAVFRDSVIFTMPTWYIVSFGVFILIATYLWWRQGLSPDKTRFRSPPIWKRAGWQKLPRAPLPVGRPEEKFAEMNNARF